MKQLFLIVVFSLFSITNSCAWFKLTINGFVDENDESKNYIVFSVPDMSQEDLYNGVLKFIMSNYKSPKDVVSELKPEMLTINGYKPSCISLAENNKMYAMGVYDMNYTVTIRFKDGKIRFDAPYFECTNTTSNKKNRLVLTGSNGGFGPEVLVGLFNKKGNPSRKHAIANLENHFNSFCSKILKSITVENDW